MQLPKVVRPSVTRFARHMEAQLLKNDNRGGWHNCTIIFLIERILFNVQDLKLQANGLLGADPITVQRTLADIGNFAMMLSENEHIRVNAAKMGCKECDGTGRVDKGVYNADYWPCSTCFPDPTPISARKEAKG